MTTSCDDLKDLGVDALEALADEYRKKIIDVMSVHGGHLSSNLGVVELTIALHKVFNSPIDKLIFDTSHQIYTHKLLTHRHDTFSTIRQTDGLYGFSAPHESEHDHFYAGHGATALSLALGCAKARDHKKEDSFVVPILGDATLTCGLAYEALDNIPKDLKKFVVILNDNGMSITKNVGAIAQVLGRLLNAPISNRFYHETANFLRKIPTVGPNLAQGGKKLKSSFKSIVGSTAPFFEHFNLAYVGPIDGHNIEELVETLEEVKNLEKPTLIHVQTTKGYGLKSAEKAPISFHGAKPFDPETGEFNPSKSVPTFPKIFGSHLMEMAEKDDDICVISPATPVGTCVIPFLEKYPERGFDVGIAEGHAVTFCGGLAHQKKTKPILSVYATFLQRGFDNVFHDICIQNLDVLFAIDRAGISGGDGITHHGIYDIGFLSAMPKLTLAQPRNGHLLKELMESAFDYGGPVAIRYPNLPTTDTDKPIKKRELGKGEVLKSGKDIAIIALGHMCESALQIQENLQKEGIEITVVDPIFLKPLDTDLLDQLLLTHKTIITLEEHLLTGGLGSLINSYILKNGAKNTSVFNYGITDAFVHPGKHANILKNLGLDSESITQNILEHLNLEVKV